MLPAGTAFHRGGPQDQVAVRTPKRPRVRADSPLTPVRRMPSVPPDFGARSRGRPFTLPRRLYMSGEPADVVMFGPKPIIEEALSKAPNLRLHRAFAAPD